MEEWICTDCHFTLVMGVSSNGIPQKCPVCGNQKWDIKGNINSCRGNAGGPHIWRKGVDKQGVPHLDPDQICEACSAVPVMEGIGN